MKTILLILILTSAGFSQEVKVTQQGNVTVDGVDKGTVINNANGKDVNPSALQAAIVLALTEQVNETKPLKDLLAKAQEALAAGDFDSLKAILTPAVDDAKLSEIQREIKRLTQLISETQKRIDELNGQLVKEAGTLKAKAAAAKSQPAKAVKK